MVRVAAGAVTGHCQGLVGSNEPPGLLQIFVPSRLRYDGHPPAAREVRVPPLLQLLRIYAVSIAQCLRHTL